MYLAPLNYDRYFKKVFSDLDIARRFLEDFLDIKIEQLEFLPEKQNITDDAQTVEFDFRCKTKDGYFIIEMQQWYKPDVVQRFYVYHALGSALQLEKMPKKLIPLPENKTKKVKDYSELMPTITIIWMVHDTFSFDDDYISYILTPEYITTFLQDSEQWKKSNCQMLLEKRNELNKLLLNTEKDIDFLQKNKLIYAFQKNIVKNKKMSKYYNWFEFAQKTLEKVADRFAYDKYTKDDIFSEMIRRLKLSIDNSEDIEYIKNYEEYHQGVARYNESIEKKQKEKYKKQLTEAKAREKEAKAREEEAKAREEEAKAREQEAKAREQEAKAREQATQIKLAKNMLKYRENLEEISKETGLTKEEIKNLK